MRTLLIIAMKEIREGLRNRWVLAVTLLLAALALTLSFLGSAPTGTVGTGALEVLVVSLSSLSIFLIPLTALLLAHDAIVGESERGTLLLLLSYPLARWQVIVGKFAGHLAILAFATLIGYGLAAVALVATQGAGAEANWAAFARLICSSVLLGAIFVAIGYLVSAVAGERGTAAGISVGVWLFFVLLYDMALLGLLVVDQGRTVTAQILDVLLLLNPTDAYRILNLGGEAGAISGLANQTTLAPATLLLTLLAWVAVPLIVSMSVFARREL